MKETATSDTTGKTYVISDAIRLVNSMQAAAFSLYGIELLDMYPSFDYDKDQPIWVYVYRRSDTREAYDLWCKHELIDKIKEKKHLRTNK